MSKLVKSTYSSRTYETGVFVIKKEWDALRAKEAYRLYKQLETFTDGFRGGSKSLHYMGQGDKSWADKNAEHYGVEIKENIKS